jgi:alkanesulfonate monooxygenase SsuD/methylene tetrahydromethanopterin reductase-like flavin-dependent oxidoreductase (luciferase family)
VRYAVDIAPLGELGDPRVIQRVAREAEATGWDGLSTWDVLGLSMEAPAADPFVALAGAAAVTERLRLIVSVAVLSRRRPQLVAQAAATLDRLSRGRFVLGVGAGGDRPDFEAFGESYEASERIARLDEALPLVDRFLRGERVTHEGRHYVVRDAAVAPPPVGQSRPPIWLGALRPGGLRRAAAWDGWIAVSVAASGDSVAVPPSTFAEQVSLVAAERAAMGRGEEPFEIAVFGQTGLDGTDPLAYEAAGATWWLESVSGMRGSVEDVLAIVRDGPAALRPAAAKEA